jgi:spore germination cell wall hydrolase CwlJ-like protein
MLSSILTCLALNVYHEARDEPLVGQYAVAHVVLNRVQSDKYPDDVCSVVKQGYVKGRRDCQFSWYCDGKSDVPREERAWLKSQLIAAQVLYGEMPDISDGSTHYHATYVHPPWAKHLDKMGQIGSHIFYRLEKH